MSGKNKTRRGSKRKNSQLQTTEPRSMLERAATIQRIADQRDRTKSGTGEQLARSEKGSRFLTNRASDYHSSIILIFFSAEQPYHEPLWLIGSSPDLQQPPVVRP